MLYVLFDEYSLCFFIYDVHQLSFELGGVIYKRTEVVIIIGDR